MLTTYQRDPHPAFKDICGESEWLTRFRMDNFPVPLENIYGAEWGRTFRVCFCVSRLRMHSDGLFVLLDLTNIIEMESGENKKL